MAINDPIVIKNDKKHGWIIEQGPEWLYDSDGYLISFDNPEDAMLYAIRRYPGDFVIGSVETGIKGSSKDAKQLELFE